MRIVAGQWRGRSIEAPRSEATRPTADRVRQALFDMLAHASWSEPLQGRAVLDGFAGSGALGLEALSRGAGRAVFFETDRAALHALRGNIARLAAPALVIAGDATRPPAAGSNGGCDLVFLDPPYGKSLIPRALAALQSAGWIAPGALVIAETARDEDPPVELSALLAERRHGAARLSVWRLN